MGDPRSDPRRTDKSVILLKNPMNASTRLSTNGKSPMISHAPPFVLRLSKDERKVFQQNRIMLICVCRPLMVAKRLDKCLEIRNDRDAVEKFKDGKGRSAYSMVDLLPSLNLLFSSTALLTTRENAGIRNLACQCMDDKP